MSEKQLWPNMWKRERKRILSEALESRFMPWSHLPSCIWCGNCTVMAFYVADLRWLITYRLHTQSACWFNFSELMTRSKNTRWNINLRRTNPLHQTGNTNNFVKSKCKLVKAPDVLRSHSENGGFLISKMPCLSFDIHILPQIKPQEQPFLKFKKQRIWEYNIDFDKYKNCVLQRPLSSVF